MLEPYEQAERYQNDLEAEYEKYPECGFCGEHIREEYAYRIDGELVCEECLNKFFREEVTINE